MFLLINQYLVDQDELEAVHPAHGAWFAEQCREGPVVMAGRQVPSVGGVVMIDVATRAEAEAFAAGDPYTSAGVAELYRHRIQLGPLLSRPAARSHVSRRPISH